MPLDKNDLKQIRTIVCESVHEQIHAEVPQIVQDVITAEVPPIVESKIYPLKNDLEWIKNRLKRFNKMESEDIEAAYKDIASLKKKTKELEIKINRLELAKS